MKSNAVFAIAAGIAVGIALGACASAGPPGASEGTAVRQAANGSIVGCGMNPATTDDVRFRQPHASPFCSRKS